MTTVIYCGRKDHPQYALAQRQMTGGGQIVTFEVEGGKDAAFRFLNALRIAKISNNLGDAKSLVTHPATTTHQRLKPEARAELGITDGMIRLFGRAGSGRRSGARSRDRRQGGAGVGGARERSNVIPAFVAGMTEGGNALTRPPSSRP